MKTELSKRTFIGETIETRVSLSKAQISEFATLCGDFNPLHHDQDFAARSRFGGIIASGPHTVALFMSMVATHFSQKGPMLGLEFSFNFRSATRIDKVLLMSWRVTKIKYKDSLKGNLVWLVGSITDSEGEEIISSSGKILLTNEL